MLLFSFSEKQMPPSPILEEGAPCLGDFRGPLCADGAFRMGRGPPTGGAAEKQRETEKVQGPPEGNACGGLPIPVLFKRRRAPQFRGPQRGPPFGTTRGFGKKERERREEKMRMRGP